MSENTVVVNPYVTASILPDTRKRLQLYMDKLQTESRFRVTYDVALNILLDMADVPESKDDE